MSKKHVKLAIALAIGLGLGLLVDRNFVIF